MKKFSLGLAGIILFSLGVKAIDSSESKTIYKVDAEKSQILWEAKKVSGAHNGIISLNNGEVHVEGSNVLAANINMDMNSIVCKDIENQEWNQKLVGHLKSEDFFSSEKFPQSVFETTSIVKNANDENYTIKGNLTIKGITHEISFPATVKLENGNLEANGTAKLDRTKWDIKYGSGKFFQGLGDNMIYDEFQIEFDLVAKAETI
jgi:polyisoprenoid-binding protein YceI